MGQEASHLLSAFSKPSAVLCGSGAVLALVRPGSLGPPKSTSYLVFPDRCFPPEPFSHGEADLS